MKITLCEEDIKNGYVQIRLGAKRLGAMIDTMTKREPVILSQPVRYEGRNIAIVIPTKLEAKLGSLHRLEFRPAWNRCFVVCHLRSTEPRLLTIDTDLGQIDSDAQGIRKSTRTTRGPGVDPEVIGDPELALPKLIGSHGYVAAVKNACAWLFENLKKVPA